MGRRGERGRAARSSRKHGDCFSRRARKEGYAARSVYKLEAIDRRHHLLRPGQRLLDLGCHPGSWLEYMARKVGPSGRVLGIDLQPTEPPSSWTEVVCADVREWDPNCLAGKARFDGVLSDMAPRTTGVRVRDHALSMALAERALTIAQELLRPGGFLLVKVFAGSDLAGLTARIEANFRSFSRERPHAVRRESKELYLLGQGLRAR